MQSGHFKTCLRCLIPLPWSDQKQQQRKALTPLFRHDEQKTGKGYASLTKSLRGADKAPKDRRTWGKPFPPASSPVLRLLRESLCLVDNLTGASPLQGNPLFLAADAGGKRLSCNEAPCRSRPMQPHEPDAAQRRPLHLPPRRTEFTGSRSRVPTNFPSPAQTRSVRQNTGFRQPEPPSPKVAHASPRRAYSPICLSPLPTAFCRAGKRRNIPTGFDSTARVLSRPVSSGMRKTKSPAGGAGGRSPQGFKRRKAPEKEPFQR